MTTRSLFIGSQAGNSSRIGAMLNSHLFTLPNLWPAGERHTRRASWTELFYDLVFASAISQLSTPLHDDYSFLGIARYAFLLALIFLAWLGYTTFSTQFAAEDLTQSALIVAQIFLIAVMAANANGPLSGHDAAGFGAAYGGIRAILALQYLRVLGIRATRAFVLRRIIGLAIAAGIWTASALLPTPLRYCAWTVALLIDIFNSRLPLRGTVASPPGATHFPERFGLLTIILLGEFVASVMRGIESQEGWSLPAATAAVLSLAFGFALWSCYSDGAAGWEKRDVRSHKDVIRQRLWIALHFLLFLNIGVIGAGVRLAIALPAAASFDYLSGFIICSSSAAVMLVIAGIAATTNHHAHNRLIWVWRMQFLLAALGILLALLASRISATALILLLFLSFAGQTLLLSLNRKAGRHIVAF